MRRVMTPAEREELIDAIAHVLVADLTRVREEQAAPPVPAKGPVAAAVVRMPDLADEGLTGHGRY